MSTKHSQYYWTGIILMLLSYPIWFYTHLFILNVFLVWERFETAALIGWFIQIFGVGAVLTVTAVIREMSDRDRT